MGKKNKNRSQRYHLLPPSELFSVNLVCSWGLILPQDINQI